MNEWTDRIEYSETNVNKFVPMSAGVYRLIYKGTDNYYVFYVGQANDLKRRLLEHLADSEPNACIKRYLKNYATYFRFIKVTLQSDRDRVEGEQISEYKPSCNDQSK